MRRAHSGWVDKAALVQRKKYPPGAMGPHLKVLQRAGRTTKVALIGGNLSFIKLDSRPKQSLPVLSFWQDQ